MSSESDLVERVSDWDGNLHKDGWMWLVRRDNGERRMGYFTRVNGWRVADGIGRTTIVSPGKVAKRFKMGGWATVPAELQVVLINNHGFYVHETVKDEIERLRTERDDALALAAKLNGEVEAMRAALSEIEQTTIDHVAVKISRSALLPTSQAGEEK